MPGWLQILVAACSVVGALGAAFLAFGRQSGATDAQIKMLHEEIERLRQWRNEVGNFQQAVQAVSLFDERFKGLTARFDKGNNELSRLTSEVNGLPDRIRREVQSELDRYYAQQVEPRFREANEERRRMWEIIERRGLGMKGD